MKLTVVHLEGSKQGQTEYAPGPVITIGRDPANNIAFDPYKDVDVSTRHATVTFQGDQVMLQDIGSKNGTFLNGARVNGAVPLPNGSVVQFGEKGPKVKLDYIFHTGPGKKTQMIQDLSSKLEGAEKETQAAGKRNKMLACCFFFLLIIGIGGWVAWSKYSEFQANKLAVASLSADDIPKAKAKAEGKGAATTPEAKDDWDKANVALAKAEEAKGKEDWKAARAAYDDAAKLFASAGETAQDAEMKRMRGALAMGNQGQADREKAAADIQEQIRKAIADAKVENDRKLAEMARDLASANLDKLKGQLGALVQSTKPDELKATKAAIEEALKKNPDDPDLKAALATVSDKVTKIENIDALLAKVAKDGKEKIVGIRSRVYAIPGGQRPDTTQIRVPVGEGFGTGFWVTADGLLVTAKEVTEPHLFNPQSAAMRAKLTEKGMQFFSDLEIMTSTAGIYTSTIVSKGMPVSGAASGKISVSRRFNDSIGAGQPVKITIDNAETTVNVQLHRRDESDLVILKVDGVTGMNFFPLSTADAAVGTQVACLGVQTGGKDLGLEEGQTGLFMFQGKVSASGRRLELDCASYPSWIGGPIVDADGKVLGMLLENGTEKSKAISTPVFATEIH
jgi:hypothetical protein